MEQAVSSHPIDVCGCGAKVFGASGELGTSLIEQFQGIGPGAGKGKLSDTMNHARTRITYSFSTLAWTARLSDCRIS
jgi:hypothetical protein